MCGGGDGGGGSSAGALAPDVAASMIGALQQSCLEFCARCYAVAGPSAGASLRKDARALAAGVVDPALGLLRALVRPPAAGGLKRGAARGQAARRRRPPRPRGSPCRGAALSALSPSPTPGAQESGDDLKRAIGLVWQGCDAVPRAGLDNKAALFKGLAGVMAVLKDTLREASGRGRRRAGAGAARPPGGRRRPGEPPGAQSARPARPRSSKNPGPC
jgi:hypothetical protein